MGNKLILSLGIGLVVLMIVLGIATLGSPDKGVTGGAIGTMSEQERYAKLSAELACDLIDNQGGDVLETLENLESYVQKYGFTVEDLESLQTKYENDVSIQKMAVEEMQELCPDSIPKIEGLN